jgi:hypothetical protein
MALGYMAVFIMDVRKGPKYINEWHFLELLSNIFFILFIVDFFNDIMTDNM